MRSAWLGACLSSMLPACGRSAVFFPNPPYTPPVPICSLSLGPGALDFEVVAVGSSLARALTLTDTGEQACHLSNIALGVGTDPNFRLLPGTSPELEIGAGATAFLSVVFAPGTRGQPAIRTGTLTFESDDPALPVASVPLNATIPDCSLNVAPTKVDFDTVPLGGPVERTVALYNDGGADCDLSQLAIAAGSDPGFAVSAGGSLTLPPSTGLGLQVSFETVTSEAPYTRVGTLDFLVDGANPYSVTLPLTARLPRCELVISPPALDFGNILLNSSVTDRITLFNDGGLDCDVSAIALAPGTDADFSLPQLQATFVNLAPGEQTQIAVTFTDLSGATEPFLRQGMLTFLTGDPTSPQAQVPLSAFVNTACQIASQWIYTVDETGMFSRFDPLTLTFTDLGQLECEAGSGPFSMAVDQNAVAWVLFSSGFLYEVSTADASCQATPFVADQHDIFVFGMSFLFNPNTGDDTLYVTGTDPGFSLATIAFPSLDLTPIGPTFLGPGEPAGTGDGELWDFIPSNGGARLVQVDPASGAVLMERDYPDLTVTGGFAMKFWGGSFWIFVGNTVQRIERDTGVWTTAIQDTQRADIVGAGVSTCAPVQ